jgi:beta-N-acetylhexosaminidase
MHTLDDSDRLAGAVIVGGFDGQTAPALILQRIASQQLAGVTLFKRNISDALQVATLVQSLVDVAPPNAPPLISIDQEGGRVARLGSPVVKLPPMRAFGDRDDTDLTRHAHRVLGTQLKMLGCTTNFAPVADVDSNPANPIIGDRAFSRDPQVVARHVVAAIEGLRDAGVLACAKHFPGHGDTELDSHLALPSLRHDLSRAREVELVPFYAAIQRAKVASVMTAHVVFEGIDRAVPATLSPLIVQTLLRQELGFDGVCFSDDLHMKAVADRYGVVDAGIMAIEAGCDALLVCSDPDSQEQLRLALASRARTHRDFADRLHQAGKRLLQMRLASPPQPHATVEALNALSDEFRWPGREG